MIRTELTKLMSGRVQLNLKFLSRMKISIIPISAFLLLLVYSTAIFAGQNNIDSVIEGLITEALQNNPQLKAYNESINSLEQRPAQVQSLDNPRLKLSIMNLPSDTFKFDQEPMTQKHISIMPKISLSRQAPSKRRDR